MTGYAIAWDGKIVTLPPAGDLNPDGVSWAWIRDDDGNGIYDHRLVKFADTAFGAQGKRVGRISVSVVLIPRPDNPFDSDAVSIALPKSMGGDEEDRCLGYLYRHTIRNWGIANDGRKDLVARLAALSADDEVHFTATMMRDSDPADFERYRCADDEEGWDIPLRVPEFSLDLPDTRIMGAAIGAFLAEHETDGCAAPAVRDPGHHATHAQPAKPLTPMTRWHRRFPHDETPRIRWLDELADKLIQDLVTNWVVNTRDMPPPPQYKIRRWGAGGSGVIVTNEDGGRIGKIRNHPVLEARLKKGHGGYLSFLLLANELDRPAAVEALAREGIVIPFDPSPGWLNASVEPGLHGWLDVYWSGNLVGLELKPRLATFNIETGSLTVFASQLADPIRMLLTRVGQQPRDVVAEPHPDGPEYFYGIDILQAAIDQTPDQRPTRRLRQEARELLPAEWTEQLEKAWSPEQPHIDIPPGLFWDETPQPAAQRLTEPARSRTSGGCLLCTWSRGGKAYCRECLKEAEEGLFSDRGFDEPWKEAVLWSLRTLAEIEFGGPPAMNQLKKPPADGNNADLLMLCRILTCRRGWTEMGAERKAYAWTDWLAEAGLLTDGFRASRGVTVMAKDGHICRSLLEREIDDFFHEHGIAHEPEPDYPYDPEHNVGGYRADWKLADGTLVEALGFPKNSQYMAKVEKKLKLAALNNIPVVSVTHEDVPHLLALFSKWLPSERDSRSSGPELPPRPDWPRKQKKSPASKTGHNSANAQARAQRIERCRKSVELQVQGLTRKQIAERLGVSEALVKSLLRDGKFYANPNSDPPRRRLAKQVADAKLHEMTCSQIRVALKLTSAKVDEAWRDADVVFGDEKKAGADGETP